MSTATQPPLPVSLIPSGILFLRFTPLQCSYNMNIHNEFNPSLKNSVESFFISHNSHHPMHKHIFIPCLVTTVSNIFRCTWVPYRRPFSSGPPYILSQILLPHDTFTTPSLIPTNLFSFLIRNITISVVRDLPSRLIAPSLYAWATYRSLFVPSFLNLFHLIPLHLIHVLHLPSHRILRHPTVYLTCFQPKSFNCPKRSPCYLLHTKNLQVTSSTSRTPTTFTRHQHHAFCIHIQCNQTHSRSCSYEFKCFFLLGFFSVISTKHQTLQKKSTTILVLLIVQVTGKRVGLV